MNSRIQSKQEEIKDPTFCKPFFQKDSQFILNAISKVERDIAEAIELLQGKQKHLQDRRTAQTKNLSDIEHYKKQVQENTEKIDILSEKFSRLKVQYGFLDEAALVRLFHHSLDSEKTALEIQQFDQKLAITRSRIAELQSEAGVAIFSEESYQSKQAELKQLQLQRQQDAQEADDTARRERQETLQTWHTQVLQGL